MSLNDLMKKKRWSPWVSGFILGLTAVASYYFAGQTIGSSGGLESIDSILANSLHLPWKDEMYFKFIMPPVFSFQILLFIGMILGALVSSLWSGDFKWRMMPDKEWIKNFGPNKAKRWLLIFLGGVILEYSAGIAGGCTSGLAISGTMQLAPAGLFFIAGLFVSGIITVKLLYRRNY